jgi:hypothetical protein
MKKSNVISFSIFGNNPKYCVGLIRNLKLSSEIFPGWGVYVYYNNTVLVEYLEEYKIFTHVKLIDMSDKNIPGMFWRFLPFEGVERFICRDADSRLISRDKSAVEEWISENTDLHIMRDHEHHHYKILGGMWGIKPKENLLHLIEDYIGENNRDLFYRMVDMDFLRDVIYPRYINSSTIHISLEKNRMEGHCRPFPEKMKEFRFVGEIVNEDESREYQYTVWQGVKEI